MKHKLLFLLLFVFLLCGCSNTLKCTKETDKEISKVNIDFEDGMPITLTWKKTLLYADGDASIEMNYLEEKDYYNKFSNVEGLTYEINKKDRQGVIVIDVNVDYSKFDIRTHIFLPAIYIDIDNNRFYLENNGYICK